MFIYLLFISMTYTHALYLDVEKILLRTKCTIPIVNTTVNISWHKPFLLRNKKYNNNFAKNEMNIRNLIHKYGNRTVGIDYPGPYPPPSPAWRTIKLRDYVKKHVLHNKTYDEYVKSDHAILWGPSDSCRLTSDCECEKMRCLSRQKFVPKHISDTFVCHEREDNTALIYGVAGKYGGLHFHRHDEVYNQLLYGKKLWYFIDSKYMLEYVNTTSAETVYDMLLREIYPPHDACIQEAGDFIFVPRDIWHMTFNFEPVFMTGCTYGTKPYIPQ